MHSEETKRDQLIKNSFTLTQDKLDTNSKIDATFSGTTCVMCFLSKNMLICANSGDSRAILCSYIGN
jgi:serine/threonine protein phosphatase PrpC